MPTTRKVHVPVKATKVGEARQSQLVTTYGVGSLFPSADQSFIIMGTEYWPESASNLDEPRLARALGVHGFRTPSAGRRAGDMPVRHFPLVHYCPNCHRLGPLDRLQDGASMHCKRCPDSRLVPSRFVAACDAGHLEDFPYWQWVHAGTAERADGGQHELTLKVLGRSSSLSDIVIGCSCGVASKSLAGSFGKNALRAVATCRGQRPWLAEDDGSCDRPLRTLQRGSSNVWFASMRSTISIPPWSSAAAAFVERYWVVLEHIPDPTLATVLAPMVAEHPGVTVEAVQAVIAQRRGLETLHQPTDAELRADEYKALCTGTGAGSALDSFICEEERIGTTLSEAVAQVSAVSRLREVRALEGFMRVTPGAPDAQRPLAPLSQTKLPWLPAVEVHGEGIFVRLLESMVAEWESTAGAAARAARITAAQDRRDRDAGRPAGPSVAPRVVALHTLAHMLLTELSLHAGYPAASLRERVYAAPGQAGILVYTASSDSAGSLGGLAALAQTRVFESIFNSAVDRGRWCSSDPVCAESRGSGADNLNLAACHACVLLPETSCENRNLYLDRVSVLGSEEFPEAALFPA